MCWNVFLICVCNIHKRSPSPAAKQWQLWQRECGGAGGGGSWRIVRVNAMREGGGGGLQHVVNPKQETEQLLFIQWLVLRLGWSPVRAPPPEGVQEPMHVVCFTRAFIMSPLQDQTAGRQLRDASSTKASAPSRRTSSRCRSRYVQGVTPPNWYYLLLLLGGRGYESPRFPTRTGSQLDVYRSNHQMNNLFWAVITNSPNPLKLSLKLWSRSVCIFWPFT